MNKTRKKTRNTWTRLAADLGIDRTTLYTWRLREDAPSQPNSEEWKIFIEENKLGNSKIPLGRLELMNEKTRREIALLDAKILHERRRVIATDQVEPILNRIATGQREELIRWCETDSHEPMPGGDLGEIRDSQRQRIDRLCDIMQGGIKRWLASSSSG